MTTKNDTKKIFKNAVQTCVILGRNFYKLKKENEKRGKKIKDTNGGYEGGCPPFTVGWGYGGGFPPSTVG